MILTYEGNSIQRNRLVRFVEFLRNIDSRNFDFTAWGLSDFELTEQTNKIDCDCGTVACALGHLAVFDEKEFFLKCNGSRYGEKYGLDIVWKTNTNITNPHDIAREYFGLRLAQTHIFTAERYYGVEAEEVTPTMVADKLQEILDDEFEKLYF